MADGVTAEPRLQPSLIGHGSEDGRGKYPAPYPGFPRVAMSGIRTLRLPLTRGYEAIVDEADGLRFQHQKWCATTTRSGHTYAMRRERDEDGTRRPVMLHRAVMNAPSGMDVDHINGDTLDCRRANLRLATRSQNTANRHRATKAVSQLRGVTKNNRGDKWRAMITLNRRRILLGSFETKELAAAAYNAAAERLFGEFASPNPTPPADTGSCGGRGVRWGAL